jgi:coenzyme Q-binding protein COQ10
MLLAAAAGAARRARHPCLLRALACAQAAGGPTAAVARLPAAMRAPPPACAATAAVRLLWSDSSPSSSSPTSRRYSERKLIGCVWDVVDVLFFRCLSFSTHVASACFFSLTTHHIHPQPSLPHPARHHSYTPSQIYAVVADVGSYDQFVPWCVRSTVLEKGQGEGEEDEGNDDDTSPSTSSSSSSSFASPPGDGDDAVTTMEAELEVGFRAFSERYTSVVTLRPGGVVAGDGLGGGSGAFSTSTSATHAPPPAATPASITSTVRGSTLFTHLDCSWAFSPGPAPGTAWLTFGIAFEFKSPLYRAVASAFFDEVVRRMVEAFEGRCGALYGGPAVSTRRRVGVSTGGGVVKRAGVRVKKPAAV